MAYYRKRKSSMTGLWTPVAATAGTVTEDDLARIIERRSTMSIGDIKGVLAELSRVVREQMADGYSVHLNGLGSFLLSIECEKTGVERKEDVSPRQITNVKVQFRPERKRLGLGASRTNMLLEEKIDWVELPYRPSQKRE